MFVRLDGAPRGRTGNPVQLRYGPAAVTPPLSILSEVELIYRKIATAAINRNGKADRWAGESEDLPLKLT